LDTFVWNIDTILLLLLTILAIFGFHRLNLRFNGYRPATTEDYLYKLAKITRKSEYDIFHEAAMKWPISEPMVEKDFKNYLLNQTIPHYVNDFIREHKHYVDKWRLPPF
jgi:hypothetical protein